MSGDISVKSGAVLDFEGRSSYPLIVTALDGPEGASGTRETMADVNVSLNEVNEAPVFGELSYSFNISEGASVTDPVGSVSATDEDVSDTPTFSFVDGAGSITAATGIPFSINSSGEIRVSGSLNYEDKSSYALHVLASDRSGTSPVTVEVTITVDNVNEVPEFDRSFV